jgi:hypothetical protein
MQPKTDVIPSWRKQVTGLGGTLKLTSFIAVLMTLLMSLATGVATAQEGHPIKGTWRGTIDMGSDTRNLVIIMDYDGDSISGMINPGRSSYRFSSSALDAPNWTLHATAETRDGVAVSMTGTLHEIGARNRYLEGTWSEAGRQYPFRITRE